MNRIIHLKMKNSKGSVEHYYHYIFGYLMPLTLYWSNLSRQARRHSYLVRSCETLDLITESLKLKGLRIISKGRHQALDKGNLNTRHEHVELKGYDHHNLYNNHKIRVFTEFIMKALKKEIKQSRKKMKSIGRTILLIDREAPNSYFLSANSEIRGSGNSRRSIPNFSNISAAVSNGFPNVVSTNLAGLTLAEQIVLFESAQVVVAQHGAGLTNIIWCKSDTKIIEINPRKKDPGINFREHFKKLSRKLDLHYSKIIQDHDHAEVEPSDVLKFIKNSLLS